MDKDWIKLDHNDCKHKDVVVISWILGDFCNFSCTYCPPELNAGYSGWINKKDVFSFVDRLIERYQVIDKKRLYFEFSGGEVTCNKDFIEILKYLKDRNCWIGILSNASRTEEYWKTIRPYLDHVCLSYHPESSKPEHFKKIVNLVQGKVATHLNIMMHPNHFMECEKLGKEIAANSKNISMSFQPIMKVLGTDTEIMEYTDEQLKVIDDFEASDNIEWTKEMKTYRGLMSKIYNDGSSEKISAPALFAAKETCFKGWKCWVGIQQLAVFYNGDIYRAWCFEGEKREKIGNVKDKIIDFPTEPVICDMDICFDICDIMNYREKLN